jgi:hypothetical protein
MTLSSFVPNAHNTTFVHILLLYLVPIILTLNHFLRFLEEDVYFYDLMFVLPTLTLEVMF